MDTEHNGASPSRLYVVAVCHLDTQWRWTVRDVIRRFLPRTLRENFALFDVFPDYVLSFEGAFRYMLAEEYFPEHFDQLVSWVARGRWRIAGSMIDAPDVNLASSEALVRHILYASQYFNRRFGRTSVDIFLPDCFGFPFSLPTIAAHCGLVGFSSQKFNKWMAPARVPFDLGVWEGPDGSRITAALNPGGYGERLTEDLSRSRTWRKRLQSYVEAGGVGVGLKYFGVGDRGGSPDEASLFWLSRSVTSAHSIQVMHSGSDQLFRDLTDEERERLPVHRGELLLPTHGTGCWTSQAILKRWNRKNELLADGAERAATVASWFAQFPYPTEQLREDWIRFLWHQMHDDLTGTSIPEAYEISWNDEVLSLNRFATVLTDAVAAVARGLDTAVKGVPLVLFNPLCVAREDLVRADLGFGSEERPRAVRVFNPDGTETPSQLIREEDGRVTVVFLAKMPALGFAVFDVQTATTAFAQETGLRVGSDFLENHRFRVEFDALGDLGSVHDKLLGREIFSSAARLELLPDRSHKWPAWEIRYEDLTAEAQPFAGQVERRVVENGPASVAVRVHRQSENSTVLQTVRLGALGAGDRIEIDTEVEWRTRNMLLKASFPLACSAVEATYDLGCGVVRRGTNSDEKHEVPAHQWADLTGHLEEWGVSILSESKYGWDKPDDHTLRLSLLRSPRTLRRFPHQATQDFGSHRFSYALYPHPGDWVEAGTVAQGARFNQPIFAFRSGRHPGPLGRELALVSVDRPNVTVRALKRSEEGGEWVVRIQETAGSPSRVTIGLGEGLGSAREVDGCEAERGISQVEAGLLHARLSPFQPRSFAIRVTPPDTRIQPLRTFSLELERDTAVASFHGETRGVDFDGKGSSIPGELLPAEIMSGEVPFRRGEAKRGQPHALASRGQTLQLPPEDIDTVFLLATAACERDLDLSFTTGEVDHVVTVRSWSRPVGRWRQQRHVLGRPWGEPAPGYVVRTPVAWVGTHRHDRSVRDEPYAFCYLFRYALSLPVDATALRLPDDPRATIFAITAARLGASTLTPAHALFD